MRELWYALYNVEMKSSKKKVEEPEIVGTGFSKRTFAKKVLKNTARGTAGKTAATFATGFAMKQATERVKGLRTRMIWIVLLYTGGIILGVIALVSLIGWALFTLLPNPVAGVILGIIVAPILFAIYFGYRTIMSVVKHPLAREYKKTIFDIGKVK